jgi:hypothetical protein
MNASRINALAAKAMGYIECDYRSDAWDIPGEDYFIFKNDWNPVEEISQALELLEHVAATRNWSLLKCQEYARGDYECLIRSRHSPDDDAIGLSYAPTVALAMTLCALRASPRITDDELNEGLEQS